MVRPASVRAELRRGASERRTCTERAPRPGGQSSCSHSPSCREQFSGEASPAVQSLSAVDSAHKPLTAALAGRRPSVVATAASAVDARSLPRGAPHGGAERRDRSKARRPLIRARRPLGWPCTCAGGRQLCGCGEGATARGAAALRCGGRDGHGAGAGRAWFRVLSELAAGVGSVPVRPGPPVRVLGDRDAVMTYRRTPGASLRSCLCRMRAGHLAAVRHTQGHPRAAQGRKTHIELTCHTAVQCSQELT